MNKPRLNTGPVTVTLTDAERTSVIAALATFAQTLHGMPQHADPAWSALAKIAEYPHVREMFGVRPPTVDEMQVIAARIISECELQLAKERTRKAAP